MADEFLSSTQCLLRMDTSPNVSPRAEDKEVSDADEELLCKPMCVDPKCGILNRSLSHLWTGICAANIPSTSVDLEREGFGASSWRRVEIDVGRVSTYSSLVRSIW